MAIDLDELCISFEIELELQEIREEYKGKIIVTWIDYPDIFNFLLGKQNHSQPALFHTDIFDITILYGSFKLEKSW
ncbi:hypothetical protein [Nostoc sp.]|uniref:hypothetical protein n=1 Tax=Nostoc sp. TaxID=1180 RepID=UPI002FF49A84